MLTPEEMAHEAVDAFISRPICGHCDEYENCVSGSTAQRMERTIAATVREAVKQERRRVKEAVAVSIPEAWRAEVIAAIFPAARPTPERKWVDLSKEAP